MMTRKLEKFVDRLPDIETIKPVKTKKRKAYYEVKVLDRPINLW